MKIGDTFYFVDVTNGKITKHKILEIVPSCTNGKSEGILFSGFKFNTHPTNVRLNPKPEEYYHSVSKLFFRGKKNYLIFTNVEDAQKALIKYALPKIIEAEMLQADYLREEYQKKINKVNKLEKTIKEQTKDFSKKCNALKDKIV